MVTDVMILESTGAAEPKVPDGFTLVATDLLPKPHEGEDAGSAPHVFLAVRLEPVDACSKMPIVDLAVVYGIAATGEDALAGGFQMSGGFETTELPASASAAYKARVYICTKRDGAGHVYAEEMAAAPLA